ncbi:hypothetical protein SAMN06265349_102382 [Flavobacterium resistens]|uniref:Uncharacterized protein n=1 Tax=Flavobacterium resistens TaxID=443612 RepID=A0A521CAW2_9FLAO|nr:hypothetical protein [Flavobacterium resistens]MRX66483.1 hypothetical protein [Flavobacterium resistens]SMO56528.1 hypothetical protein SAMN06265349_102382 [Flavobacterium resistens]
MISYYKDTEEKEIKIPIHHTVCHFDEGEISARNSTKIGDILYGATRGDFSFVEMTKQTE